MLLLDSHVLLWYLHGPPRCPRGSVSRLDVEPQVFVSAASLWELRIKHAAGKLPLADNLEVALRATALTPLPITWTHALAAGGLVRHHGDPFDRMLIAQAQLEGLIIVTHDTLFRPYGVPILWTSETRG